VQSIGRGQGLAGQVMIDRKTIIINDLPNDYFSIQSLTGKAAANSLIIHPFVYDGELLAVIELASLSPISMDQKKFISMVDENISIAIMSARHRSKTDSLLQHTQKQTVELQVRQA
jgi:putative methionine-R-sulfoxide reductase with GAF domain